MKKQRIVRTRVVHEPVHRVHDVLLRGDEPRVLGVVGEEDDVFGEVGFVLW